MKMTRVSLIEKTKYNLMREEELSKSIRRFLTFNKYFYEKELQYNIVSFIDKLLNLIDDIFDRRRGFLNKSILVRFITNHGRVHYKLLDVEKNDIFKEIRKIFDVIIYDEN